MEQFRFVEAKVRIKNTRDLATVFLDRHHVCRPFAHDLHGKEILRRRGAVRTPVGKTDEKRPMLRFAVGSMEFCKHKAADIFPVVSLEHPVFSGREIGRVLGGERIWFQSSSTHQPAQGSKMRVFIEERGQGNFEAFNHAADELAGAGTNFEMIGILAQQVLFEH